MSISRDLSGYTVQQLMLVLQDPRVAKEIGVSQAAAYNELKARPKQQEAAQGMAAQQEAAKPSLKDQLVAQAQAQGVAGLPVRPDMYQEQSFAQGGIVAFADGDQVFGRELTAEEYASLTPQQKTAYDRQFFNTRMDRASMKPFAAAADILTLPYNVGANLLESGLNAADFAGFGRMAGFYEPDVTSVRVPKPGQGASLTPYYDMIRRKEMIDTSVKPNIPASGKQPGTPVTPKKEAILPNKSAQMIADENAARIRRGIERGEYGPAAAAPAANAAVDKGLGSISRAGVPGDIKFEAPKLDEGVYDSLMGQAPTREGIAELMAAERAKRGIDNKFFDKQLADLATDVADVGKRRDKNFWESIAIGGLETAAGTSQFGLQNIARGLGMGVKNLIATDKDLRAEQRALRKENNDILAAQQARREAQMQGDMAEFQRQEARYQDLLGKKQQRIDANITNAQNAVNEGKKLNFDRDLKVWQVGTETASAERRAEIAAAPYNKLFTQQVRATQLDMSTEKARQDYINDQIKGSPVNAAKKALVDQYAGKDISTLPADKQKRILEARQWYNGLAQEAVAKFQGLQGIQGAGAGTGLTPNYVYVPGKGLVQQ